MIYVRQYGVPRSGTNYLMYLLTRNFTGIKMLFNVIGSKHEVPVHYKNWLLSAGVGRVLGRQKVSVDHLLKSLSELRFAISIRNPYSWVLGFQNYMRGKKRKVKVSAICKRANHRYRIWYQKCQERCPRRSMIVRLEDLWKDSGIVLEQMRLHFGLTKKKEHVDGYCGVAKRINSGGTFSGSNFNQRNYYLTKKYMSEFTPEMKAVVDRHIDWTVWGWYGYKPE